MLRRALITSAFGASTTLAFAPFNYWIFALLSPVILLFTLRNTTTKQAAFLGWLFGLGFFGSGVSWVYVSIHTYGDTVAPLAALLTTIFCAALALLFSIQAWFYQRFFSKRYAILGFAVIWLLFEWLRSWLFTGFPWLYLGYAAIDTPISQLASIGGVWLLSALVLAISLAAASFVYYNNQRLSVICSAVVLIILSTTLLLPKQWTYRAGEQIDIAILQPNIPQQIKWKGLYLEEIISQYYKSTLPLIGENVIIWPETAIPSLYPSVEGFFSPLVSRQIAAGGAIISGVPTKIIDPDFPKGRRIHNSIYNLTQDSIYHKQRLVPFGEYIPWQQEFEDLFNFLNIPDFTFSLPKQIPQPLMQVGNFHFSTAICYEIAYPELVREYSKNADVILTLSNDTWFTGSIGPDQHFQIARMRAIENNRWLIRSANNGISAIVDPQGKVKHIAPRYVEAVLKGSVEPLQGLTPYQRMGSLPLIISYLLIAVFLIWINRRRSTRAV
jgi:apolipoprotein N-acyltransferase